MVFYNDYLFIIGDWPYDFFRISGVFEEPDAVDMFTGYCDSTNNVCPPTMLDKEFPIDGELIEPLISLTSERLIAGVFSQQIPDQTPNSKEDLINARQ